MASVLPPDRGRQRNRGRWRGGGTNVVAAPWAGGFGPRAICRRVCPALVVPCYLIRHPQGDLVWDTGLPQAMAELPDGSGPSGVRVAHKLIDQLQALGLTPADIEFLSVSHSI